MPRGPNRPWKQLAPHTTECIPYVNAALEAGYDKPLVINDIPDMERFDYLRRGLFRAAMRAGVSLSYTKKKTGDTYQLTFQIHDKAQARKRIIEKYGEDRELWPYNPRRRGNT